MRSDEKSLLSSIKAGLHSYFDEYKQARTTRTTIITQNIYHIEHYNQEIINTLIDIKRDSDSIHHHINEIKQNLQTETTEEKQIKDDFLIELYQIDNQYDQIIDLASDIIETEVGTTREQQDSDYIYIALIKAYIHTWEITNDPADYNDALIELDTYREIYKTDDGLETYIQNIIEKKNNDKKRNKNKDEDNDQLNTL